MTYIPEHESAENDHEQRELEGMKDKRTIYDLRIEFADNSEHDQQIAGNLESLKPHLPVGFYEVIKSNIDGFFGEHFSLSMTSSQTLKTYKVTTIN